MALVLATNFNPCPKPRSKVDAIVDDLVAKKRMGASRRSFIKTDPAKVRAWQDRSRKPIARKAYLPRATKPIPQVNVRATSRRGVRYRQVISSAFHKELRYRAFVRSGGLCECEECVQIRATNAAAFVHRHLRPGTAWTLERITRAFTQIPVWFTKKGSEPWMRFRSNDGETHHTSYHLFGEENFAELELVQWTWESCHHRIEAEHGTRRRFLKGRKAA